jgi:hypothetical protein
MKAHYVTTIEKYSDYNAHDPYWINLCQAIEDENIRQSISTSINQYFRKHGPDANEDYTSFTGPLMKYETAEKAVKDAFNCRKKLLSKVSIDIQDLIDGVGSLETDGREIDPITGELLHTIPVNKRSVIDEIDCLIEQDELSKDDWVWLDFVVNGFGEYDSEVNAKLRQLTRKHR